MRTTLDISQLDISHDVILAARELAARRNVSMGEVISELARASLRSSDSRVPSGTRNGFPLLAPTGQVITSEFIKTLMDAEE